MTSRVTAEFVPSARGRIFVVARQPTNFNGKYLLVAPPFAEEMNKSRNLVAKLAVMVNACGLGVVMPDYFGTGDSDGDFSETDCDTWLHDLSTVHRWAESQGWSLDAMLGIRLGCIVAAAWMQSRTEGLRKTVFWQPVVEGARSLDQFLRLRVAASLMETQKETIAQLKGLLHAGEVVQVAGYGVSPALAAQMERLKLVGSATTKLGRVEWIEVVRSAAAGMPIPALKAIEQLQAAGVDVHAMTNVGEPFWSSVEMIDLPNLIDTTAELLTSDAT